MENHILQKYIEGKATPQEEEKIIRWIDTSEENWQAYLIQRNIYDATLWSDAPVIKKRTSFKKKSIIYELLKIASVFLLVLGSFYFLTWNKEEAKEIVSLQMQTIYIPEGQRAEVRLGDGTKVWLNAKTTFTFPEQFNGEERRVKLDGEGYFDVAHDETQDFIVQTSKYQVKVLGTEFNIKAYSHQPYFETALLRGSVEVIGDNPDEKILLTPNTYVYEREGQLTRAILINHDQFLWKDGIIAFEKETVRDIFSKLELYYDVKIQVKNTRILDFPYTGKFRTKDGVEHVLRVLQLRHKFSYTKDNDKNIIVIQ